MFLGPGNPDKMLEMEYGDYMQWPNDAGSTAHGAKQKVFKYIRITVIHVYSHKV